MRNYKIFVNHLNFMKKFLCKKYFLIYLVQVKALTVL
jgi:hypothetical protein